MKLVRKSGSTSNILQVFIADSSSVNGSGLTGLVFNSSSLTAYYHRDNQTTATAITLVTMTVGTFTSSGFKEIDATNMPGWYQFCPPDAAFGSSAKSVCFHLKGATNMVPLPIEVDLWAVDPQVATNFGLTCLPTVAAGASTGLLISGSNSGTTTLGAATITGTLTISDGIVVTRSSSNSDAVAFTGSGTGNGLTVTSGNGATGDAIKAISNSTNGNGLSLYGKGTGAGNIVTGGLTGNAVSIIGGGTSGKGISITTTSGDGISVVPTAGHALTLTANGTSKHGLSVTGGTAGTSDGISAVAGTGGVPIRGNITGDITGNLSGSIGSYTGDTPQTGDAYARLGAPSGASVSADLVTIASYIDTEVAAIKAKTDNLPASPAATGDAMSISTAGLARMFTQDSGKVYTDAVAGSVVKEIVSNAAGSGSDTPGTTTLLSRLTATRAGYLDNLTNLDAAVSSRSTYAGGDTSGTTTLLSRLSSARAGYLDNLNVGGVVASQADVNALNQSASRRIIITTVQQYERPESGSFLYTIEVRTYDGDGAAVNADSTPTITATGKSSGSLAANLGSISNPSTGLYRADYTVLSSAVSEEIRFDASATISSSTFTLSAFAQVVNYVSATWTSTDSSNLTAIFNKLPARDYLVGTDDSAGALVEADLANLDVAVSTRAAPGDEMALTGAALTDVADEVWSATLNPNPGYPDSAAGYILGTYVDVAVSSRSAPGDDMGIEDAALSKFFTVDTGQQAQSSATRSVVHEIIHNVSAGTIASSVADAVWDESASAHIIVGSTGELLSFVSSISDLPTADENADALLDRSNGVESGLTLRQWLRLAASALFGKSSGAGTPTVKFRDISDSTDRITATVTSKGDRTSVTLDDS